MVNNLEGSPLYKPQELPLQINEKQAEAVKVTEKAITTLNAASAERKSAAQIPVPRKPALPQLIIDFLKQEKDTEERTRVMQVLLSTYGRLSAPKDGDKKIVWRGCNPTKLYNMAKYGSAEGSIRNQNATAPTEEEARKQVGEIESFPEFTLNPKIAEQFGRRGYVAAFEIESRYLTQGSNSESGWVAHKDAPVKLLSWKDGEAIKPKPQQSSYFSFKAVKIF